MTEQDDRSALEAPPGESGVPTLRVPTPRRPSAPAATARITVIVVTYNSGRHVGELLEDLRRQGGGLRLRVVAVDNASRDGTTALLRSTTGVELVASTANLGYSGGINLVWESAVLGSDAILVANPDLRLEDTALAELWTRLQQPHVGAVVPRMLTSDGELYPSLRYEPTLARSLGDALLGARLRGRPRWSTTTDHAPSSYDHAHPIDWATGACLLVRSDVARTVGPWDERYFLYSEEVDYLRRIREAGWQVWYEPASRVRHEGGGSGTSAQLAALQAVNAVRYAERWHGPTYALAVRAAAVLRSLLRMRRPGERTVLHHLLRRSSWTDLPRADEPPSPAPGGAELAGSVVIPAHNEASVIRRSVVPLAGAAAAGDLEVIVSANGCTDETVDLLADLDGVTVLDSPVASKPAALNAGDAVASRWPRLYLDADVEISPRAVADVFRALRTGPWLAARPCFVYDTTGASWPVRAYYRARARLPETRDHLWGGGSYALSEAGHRRLGTFPDLIGDDLHVDSLFSPAERVVVQTEPVRVHTPRDVRTLVATLGRVQRGNTEGGGRTTTGRVARQLVGSVSTPARLLDALVYAAFALLGRRAGRRVTTTWARDDRGREAA